MKREALDHWKFRELCDSLADEEGYPAERYRIVGALEMLWHFTARYYPDGLLPLPWERIARWIDWGEGDLRGALVRVGFLDEVPGGLLVHDWPEHADSHVHAALAKRGMCFADGTPPKLPHDAFNAQTRARIRAEFTKKSQASPGPSRTSPEKSQKVRAIPEPQPQPQPELEEEKHMGDDAERRAPRSGRDGFAQEFESEVRPRYPRRDGDQRWQEALGRFRAARKSGVPLDELVSGLERYARWCQARGIVGTDKVKQAASFFGRERCWRESWEVLAQESPEERRQREGRERAEQQREEQRVAAEQRAREAVPREEGARRAAELVASLSQRKTMEATQ